MISVPNKYMGIILYNIQRDGCLNGVYSNLGVRGEIYNEICRRKDNVIPGILGAYYSMWFDQGNDCISDRELNIRLHNNTPGIFEFEWTVAGAINFVGIGYQMNDTQIALTYWDPK
jgi:hypothetical protein